MKRDKLLLLVIAGLLIWVFGPHSLYLLDTSVNSNTSVNNTVESQIANLENQYRVTITQAFVGIAVLFGVYQTWQRISIAEDNLRVSQEGQITERFTRAIDQLGSKKLEIRLGGIYALERIANESDKDYWQIMEILSYYIRSNSHANIDIIDNEEITNKFEEYLDRKLMISYDIRAILIVIKRRKYFFKAGEPERLELREAYLRLANLSKAHLEGSYLYDSDLIGAHLGGAYLNGVYLGGARLNWAYCNEAHFEEAHLEEAHLEETCLKGANFKGADFKGAYLGGAYLMEACLIGAKNLSADQLSKVKTLYNAKLDEKLRRSLEDKYPESYQILTKKPDYYTRQSCREMN